MFFLASADPQGHPDCSYKGGLPGFVRVTGPRELAFPSYDGNGMFRSLGNLLVNPAVALLFIDFERPFRLRAQGTAELSQAPELMAHFKEADLVVRVAISELWMNCPRYIHRHQRVKSSRYVPREAVETLGLRQKMNQHPMIAHQCHDRGRVGGAQQLQGLSGDPLAR